MKILIADDAPDCRQWMEMRLSRMGYDVVACVDGATAWDVLQQEDAPLLAILDWTMPGMTGIQICESIRKLQDRPYTYVLLLTARSQREDLLTALQAGVDDYLTKPVDSDELMLRLRAGERILDWQSQLIAAQEELRIKATRDALTGLWNRESILEHLDKELERGRRDHKPVGVVMVDIDHFKRVNDTHGHEVGDVVLREISSRLSRQTRSYDRPGRYGGEEFLMVLAGVNEIGVMEICERMRSDLQAHPIQHEGITIPITASFGAVVAPPDQAIESRLLIRAADRALYQAKDSGRNRSHLGVLD